MKTVETNSLSPGKFRVWHPFGEFVNSTRVEIFLLFTTLFCTPKIAPEITALMNLLHSELATVNSSISERKK